MGHMPNIQWLPNHFFIFYIVVFYRVLQYKVRKRLEKMALKQTKVIQQRSVKKSIHKTELAKELNTSTVIINQYILGDVEAPPNLKIIPERNGMLNVEYITEVEVPKYEGVFYNELKNGDKTFYVVYKDLKTNKKVDLKVGRESDGITEKFCSNKRKQILEELRLGNTQNTIKNRRIFKEISTLDMIAEQYHKNRELHLSPENLRDAKALYNNHISPFIGDKDIESITDSDIENIMLQKKDTLSHRTINIIVEKISTIFNFSIKKKLFSGSNPARSIEKLSENNERTRFLSTEEINELLKNVKTNDILYLFTVLSLTTGGRLKTICDIKIQDIDLKHKIITLYDFKNKTNYQGFIKDDKFFTRLLKKHMKDKNPTDFLLGRETLVAIYRYIQRTLSKILDTLFNQALLKSLDNYSLAEQAEKRRNKVVIHTLRHTFASQLVINGTPIFTVQNLMNHKDLKMTQRYAKLAPDSGRNSINDIF